MAITPTYPGVYVQEIDSGVRTLAGVPTSVAAFVGRAQRGLVEEPSICFNFGDFVRRFGGLWTDSAVSYAVEDFFNNGGGQCVIVRLFEPLDADNSGSAAVSQGSLNLMASSPGTWGNSLTISVTHPKDSDAEVTKVIAAKIGVSEDDLFDLVVTDTATNASETYRNLSVKLAAGQYRYDRALVGSNLVRMVPGSDLDGAVPPTTDDPVAATGGNDGAALTEQTYTGDKLKKTGMQALRKADIFNLLCIPPQDRDGNLSRPIREAAAKLCRDERALFVVDPPVEWDRQPQDAAQTALAAQKSADDMVVALTDADHAALYFPRIEKRDRLRGGQMDVFPPCGAVAGVMARTDVNRGVFKAPAGLAATLSGVEGLTVNLTDDDNGLLNPIGVNCLRSFPGIGRVVWGARTLRGSDQLSDDYKYVSVRRLALYIEESLFRGTQWVVFEGNDEALWSQIRLAIGSFMQRLFLQGAFQGSSPREAYFVKCDAETTTQDDINRGIVNISVGFAPLQPAEFVMISIQQIRSAS